MQFPVMENLTFEKFQQKCSYYRLTLLIVKTQVLKFEEFLKGKRKGIIQILEESIHILT